MKIQKAVTVTTASQPTVSAAPAAKKSAPIPLVNKNKQKSEVSDASGRLSAAKSQQPVKSADTQQIKSTVLEQELEKNKAKYAELGITTPEQLLNFLQKSQTDDKEVQNLLKAYETEQAGKNPKTENKETISPDDTKAKPKTLKEQAAESKMSEYKEVYSKSGTAYEKTSRVIDKYLNENDSNYSALKSEKDKQKYRDGLISSFRDKRNLKKDMTSAQREVMFNELAEFITDAGVKGDKINSTKNNKIEINLDKTELNNRVDNLPMHKLNKVFEKILNDPKKSSAQQLNEIMDTVLTQNDPKYRELKSLNEKQAYIESKIETYGQKIFGIDPKVLKEDKETFNKLILAAFDQIKKDKNLDVSKLVTDTKEQQKFIAKLADNINLDEIKTNNPKVKETMKTFQTKAKVYLSIDKEGTITERDIANKLKLMNKNGELNTPELKELYQYYIKLEKTGSAEVLNQEANMGSLVNKSMLVNKTPEEYMKTKFAGKERKELIQELNDTYFRNSFSSDVEIKMLHKFLIDEKHFTVEEANRQIAHMFPDKADLFMAQSMANGDVNTFSHIENGIAACRKENVNFMSTAQLNKINSLEKKTAQFFDLNQMKQLAHAQSDEAYALFGEARTNSINTYYNTADRTEYRNYMATSADISSAKKSLSTKFFIKTGSPEQQLNDAKYYSTISDASVTEGLAAAEKYVDSSVKSQYSSYVDNAIRNNGYSQEQISSINKARQTGQTSYEREVAQSSSSDRTQESQSSTSSSNSSSSSKADRTERTTSSTQTTQKAFTYVSTDTQKKYQAAINQMLVADSEAKRDAATLAAKATTEKIQKEVEAWTEKQNTQKAKEEVAAAKKVDSARKEASEKTEQQQKEDVAKVANETVREVQTQGVSIPAEKIEKIKTAAQNGQLGTVYNELGTISAEYQQKFIQVLSTKDTATIIGFISSVGQNIPLIRYLVKLNPALIKSLPASTLASLNIEKKDIIRYADARQLSTMFADLRKTGNTASLKEFYNILGGDAQQYMDVADLQMINPQPITNPSDMPGGDNWMRRIQGQAKASNYVATNNNNEPDDFESNIGLNSNILPNWKQRSEKFKSYWV